MNMYFAPLEGVTGYIYRNAHHAIFGGVDKYFTPFIVANQKGKLRTRELQDIDPSNNKGVNVVPQILTNKSADFLPLSREIYNIGYQEVNLNLGCPSGTVVAKRKGAGFLGDLKGLEKFLDEIFEQSEIKISIKTRIGVEDEEEFYQILKLYNQYPIEELIIHPRIQKEYYKNYPHMDVFQDAMLQSVNPICYNGDIFTVKDYKNFKEVIDKNPEKDKVTSIMLGRGLIGNPALANEIQGKERLTKENLLKFHDCVYQQYQEVLSGDRNVLFRMKELWFYMKDMFENPEKEIKKIKKAERLDRYQEAVESLFSTQQLKEIPGFRPKR